ncbi:MAG: FtsQ-type POTRA domain-containing protein [Candidatus Moraniibacteriota bacterium]
MYRVIGSRKEKKRQQLEQKNNIAWMKWTYQIMVVIFFVTAFYVLFFSPQLAVTSIKVSGLDRVEESPIRMLINEEMRGKYFGIVDKKNLILFRKNKIKTMLLNGFKRIEDVQIKKIFPNTLEFIIKERKLSMLLCGTSTCYTLDENGLSYPASNFTQEELAAENLVTLKDLSNSQFDDEVPLEKDFRLFILGLAEAVQDETGINFKKNYETSNRMSGDLKIETQDGWIVYFNESVGLEKSISVLRAVLENKIEKDLQKDLEYIDLRVNNKVFYKFKSGAQSMVENIESAALDEKKKDEKKKK